MCKYYLLTTPALPLMSFFSSSSFLSLNSFNTFIHLFCTSLHFFSFLFPLFLLIHSFLPTTSYPFSPTLQYVGAEDSMLQAVFCLLVCLRNLFYLLKVLDLGLFVPNFFSFILFVIFICSAHISCTMHILILCCCSFSGQFLSSDLALILSIFSLSLFLQIALYLATLCP